MWLIHVKYLLQVCLLPVIKSRDVCVFLTGVFLLCWVPFFTINIINAICIRYNLFDENAVCQIDQFAPLSDRSDSLLVPRLARLHEQLPQPRHLHHFQHGVPSSIQEDSTQPVQLPMNRSRDMTSAKSRQEQDGSIQHNKNWTSQETINIYLKKQKNKYINTQLAQKAGYRIHHLRPRNRFYS